MVIIRVIHQTVFGVLDLYYRSIDRSISIFFVIIGFYYLYINYFNYYIIKGNIIFYKNNFTVTGFHNGYFSKKFKVILMYLFIM